MPEIEEIRVFGGGDKLKVFDKDIEEYLGVYKYDTYKRLVQGQLPENNEYPENNIRWFNSTGDEVMEGVFKEKS